ncbi:MAG: A/G-specific adenine glycosylase [Paludibacteraceae bacterium]|nr:A/G-specific adenine glycosylase [Paludibacteraceae bacterium]MBQ2607592.1 A/G-specific adenine glycosylase [Paludibacteraceae bacterium]
MNLTHLYTKLYPWWEQNHRVLPWRETRDAYRIWLSEIILQQTRVMQGMDYYLRFIERWPTVEALAAADEQEVMRAWQGLGYYSRARNLYKSAQMIVERGWAPFPTRFEDIRSLPGIGDYTAGAIAAFAYDMPYPAMDGNVYRVVARLFDIEEAFDTSAGKRLFHECIETILDRAHPGLFDAALMELGALHCTPTLTDTETGELRCLTCPLSDLCQAYAHGTAQLLPVRKPRPVLRDRYLNYTIYLTEREGTVYTLIRQRTERDIWHHLWEFPLRESENGLLPAEKGTQSIDLKHILSHQRLYARFQKKAVRELPNLPDTRVVALRDLDEYGLSRLTLIALEKLL